MTKHEAIAECMRIGKSAIYGKMGTSTVGSSTTVGSRRVGAMDIAIECIENLDILVDFVVSWSNQDIICDDLYDYDEVGEDSWCARNCKSFNRECVLKWLEYKRGVKND